MISGFQTNSLCNVKFFIKTLDLLRWCDTLIGEHSGAYAQYSPKSQTVFKKLVSLLSGCILVMTRPKGRTYRIYAQGYKCLPLLIGLRKHAPPTHRPITQINRFHVKHSPATSRDEPNIMRTAQATQLIILGHSYGCPLCVVPPVRGFPITIYALSSLAQPPTQTALPKQGLKNKINIIFQNIFKQKPIIIAKRFFDHI